MGVWCVWVGVSCEWLCGFVELDGVWWGLGGFE